VTFDRRRDRRRGGRATARPDKTLAASSASLPATIYRGNYPADDPTRSERLEAIRQLRECLDEEEQQIVFGLRLRQTSWQTIGDMFGITRQAAQQRFAVAALIDRVATVYGRKTTP
jgi:DNA-directed RNA polymerase specialized sigma24 family protein